jgi:membrane protease YdiL (CAAX protease family)
MQNQPQLPPEPNAAAPLWIRLSLFGFSIFLLDILATVFANIPLQALHFFNWFYGDDAVQKAGGPGSEVMLTRMALWSAALAFPLWAGGVAVLLRGLAIVAPVEVGLTLHNFGRSVLLGLASALVTTPAVLGLNYGVAWLFKAVWDFSPKEHPLAQAGQHGLFTVEWALLAITVMIAAPAREELLFRGVLQRLFTQHFWGAHVAMFMALLVALASLTDSLVFNRPSIATIGPKSLLAAAMPVIFILVMFPIYAVVCLLTRARKTIYLQNAYPDVEPADGQTGKQSPGPAVFATALLFGAVHSFAWPTPIALFVLGLVLGYLALRTRSLIAPMVLHGLFNAVSFVLLIMGIGS